MGIEIYNQDGRPDKNSGESSGKLLIIIIVLAVLVCIVAVLIWLSIINNKPVTAAVDEENQQPFVTAQVEPQVEPVATPAVASEQPEAPVQIKAPVQSATTAQALSDIPQNKDTSTDTVQYLEHIMQEGETLTSIAEMYGLRIQTILSINQIANPSSLHAGTVLSIPDRNGTIYIVQEGDMLSTITRRLGLSIGWKTLQDLNGITEGQFIKVGQKLFIPDEPTATTNSVTSLAEDSSTFTKPLDGSISAVYGQMIKDQLTGESVRLEGILMQSADNLDVTASASGTIVDKGPSFIKIAHEGGYTTYYDYLALVSVEISQKVATGEKIGEVGLSGSSYTTPTLFFRIEQEGIPLNPYSFFK